MPDATLVLNDLPPSFNKVGFTGNRWQLTRAVKRWKTDMATLCLLEHVPRGLRRVEAAVTLIFPQDRRRDAENYRVVLSKALGDALVEYGAIVDDTAEHFEITAFTLRVTRAQRRTVVALDWTCAS